MPIGPIGRARRFVDGNKRTGAHAAILPLTLNSHEIAMIWKELEEVTLAVARGGMEVGPLTIWFRQRISRVV